MAKKALVIGATGLIGRALTDQLAAAEGISQVVTLTRREVPHPSPKVHNQIVDFARLEDVAGQFSGDLLFSCLGTTRKQAGSIAAQRQVDLDYQLHAAQIAAARGVAHYLLVSSSGANAHSRNPYLQMKGELEDAVLQLPFARISLFRPSLLLGERQELRIGEKLGSWILPLLCTLPGLRKYRPIRGAQVAAKMVAVSLSAGPARESFTLDEIFQP